MKFVSWNVNGLRACLKKGFAESMLGLDADFICLQETKMERGQAEVALPGYHEFWNSADKPTRLLPLLSCNPLSPFL